MEEAAVAWREEDQEERKGRHAVQCLNNVKQHPKQCQK